MIQTVNRPPVIPPANAIAATRTLLAMIDEATIGESARLKAKFESCSARSTEGNSIPGSSARALAGSCVTEV